MSKNYSISVKKEILANLPAMQCCQQSFLVGLIKGGKASPFIRVHKSLRPKLYRALTASAAKHCTLTLKGSLICLDGLDQLALRKKFVDRMARTSGSDSGGHCYRAFLQGIFLADGYIQHPARGYHLELRLRGRWRMAALKTVARAVKLRFAHVEQASHHLFYLKKSKRIARFFNSLGLFDRALELSDMMATKGILSMVNRQVNFETANINRLIDASEQAIGQIKELLEYHDQEIWTEGLRQLAILRIKFPHDSLENLGRRFEPNISKSAVNHRLRRVKAMYAKYIVPHKNDDPE